MQTNTFCILTERCFIAADNITAEVDLSRVNFHSVIGVTLVLGFTLMLLIDQLSSKYIKGK